MSETKLDFVLTEAKIKQRIGQLEASCNEMESTLNERDFQDYCDHIYSCISYYRQSLYKLNKLNNNES